MKFVKSAVFFVGKRKRQTSLRKEMMLPILSLSSYCLLKRGVCMWTSNPVR
ncbi:MAG: hypothetical protein K2N63_16145 [Lachnospiraceae bacterium]|nr:hypothetical protein [Lachnospiraceae bacterium]